MNIKKHYNRLIIIGRIFVIFWVSETIFFLLRDGSHYKAISYQEKICDNITMILMYIVIFYFVFILYKIIEIFAKADYWIEIEKNNKNDLKQ